MSVETEPKRVSYRSAETTSFALTKREAYKLCCLFGKPASLEFLKNKLKAAAKNAAPADLNALRRTITELEEQTEEEIARKLRSEKH